MFHLELEAISRVWDAGHTNFHVMLPFVRTVRELERCRVLVAEAGLLDRPGFEPWMMAEVPSVLFNLEQYAELGIAGHEYAELLVRAGIDAISVSPDAVDRTRRLIAMAEQRVLPDAARA